MLPSLNSSLSALLSAKSLWRRARSFGRLAPWFCWTPKCGRCAEVAGENPDCPECLDFIEQLRTW